MLEDFFKLENYTFVIAKKELVGNVEQTSYQGKGLFRLKDGLVVNNNAETINSNATLHIKPTEEFMAVLNGNLIGNIIERNNKLGGKESYRIVGQSVGEDYDFGELFKFRVTLQREDLTEWESSQSLLT